MGMKEAMTFLDELAISPRVAIVFDELASNIVRCAGAKVFDLTYDDEGDGKLIISDDGIRFDPTAVQAPDVTCPVEKREIGGLGLFMVKKMSKSFTYRYEGDKNITEVVF